MRQRRRSGWQDGRQLFMAAGAGAVNNELLRERRTRLVLLFAVSSEQEYCFYSAPQRRPSRSLSSLSLSLAHVLTTKLDIETAASVRISPFLSPSNSRSRAGARRPTTDPTDRPKRRERERTVLVAALPLQVLFISNRHCGRASHSIAAAFSKSFPLLISRAPEIVRRARRRKFCAVLPSRRRRAGDIQSKRLDGRR